jgi:hypothetical protein
MQLVAIGTGNAVHFMLAARPVRPGTHTRFVTAQTGCIPSFCRRKVFGFAAKHHIRMLAARIALMLDTGAVTGLATGSAPVGLHTMLGLVDGEYRRTPIRIVADGALLVAFQRSVDLCQCGQGAEKYRNAGTSEKKPNQFAHLFPSLRESGLLLLALRPEHSNNPRNAEFRIGKSK